jgi:hypothetical protein
MGRGRARVAVLGVVAALVLALAGCGAESHPNEQRPQAPTRVSITIQPGSVTVQPARIGVGPARTQQIPQNQNHAQPPIRNSKAPLNVVVVTANQTRFDSHLVIRGPRRETSGPIFANSPGNFQTELPAGTYTVSAADIPGAGTAKLVVGDYRASSQNDVLLP